MLGINGDGDRCCVLLPWLWCSRYPRAHLVFRAAVLHPVVLSRRCSCVETVASTSIQLLHSVPWPCCLSQVHGLAQQNSQLKEELRAAREKLKAIAVGYPLATGPASLSDMQAKASADLAAEREDHQRVVVSMKREFATAETR